MSELHCELLRQCRRHDGGLSIHLKGDRGAVLREQLRAGGVGRSTALLSACPLICRRGGVQPPYLQEGMGTAPLSSCWYPPLRSILQNSRILSLGFPCGSVGKESACNAGDLGSIPGLGRSPGEGKRYPLQYSGLENSMVCIVHGVAKSQKWLSDFHFQVWKNLKSHWAWTLCPHLGASGPFLNTPSYRKPTPPVSGRLAQSRFQEAIVDHEKRKGD